MENKSLEQNKVDSQQNLRSFKLYTGKAPLLLQVVAGVMFLSGLSGIVSGFFILFFLPVFGVILFILAGFSIKYAVDIFKMKKIGYVGGMAVVAANVAISLAIIFIPNININMLGRKNILTLTPSIVTAAALYYYREKFVN
jgi:hypothetical protein